MKDIIDYSTKSNVHIHFWEEATVNKIIPLPKENPLVYSKKVERFDRFRLNLESEVYPVINIGDTYFTMNVFQKLNPSTFTLNKLLLTSEDNESQNEAVKKMEDDLAKRFRMKGWNSKSETELTKNSGKRYLNRDEGDVDIYLEDNTGQILIQFKRNKLRTELSEIIIEKKSDKKATKQLNDALLTFKSNPSKYPLNNPIQENVKKWVISTSHEWIGMIDEDVRKVNYFDVLELINSRQIRTVRQLIEHVENDRLLFNYVKKNPIQIFKPVAYVLGMDLSTENDKNIEAYNHALELDKNSKKKEAIKKLINCLELSPNDPSINGAIANIYADLRQWNDANNHFEKALKILPQDPFINRNYGMAQLKQGKRVLGLKRLLENGRCFPLLFNNRNITLSEEAQLLIRLNFEGGKITENDYIYLMG